MFEVEQKFHLQDAKGLATRLLVLGATEQAAGQHADTYFNHPSRDFAQTGEALRIRRVDGVPLVTYKGPKLPGDVKARREMEWRLDPGDPDGTKTEQLWLTLGFRQVAMVYKCRRSFEFAHGGPRPITVTLDEVTDLGIFAEVELVVATAQEVDQARETLLKFSHSLGLKETESRSYLSMLLELNA